jgi:hypothetical protein
MNTNVKERLSRAGEWMRTHTEKKAQQRATSFAKLQDTFSDCDLTEEEIRQECETVRQQMYHDRAPI